MKTTILWFYDIHLFINTKANKRSEFFCHVFVASRIQHYRLSLKLYLGWPFITLTLAFRTSSGFQIFVASFLQNLMLQSEQVQFKWYCQIFCKFLSPLCWIWCQTAEEALIFFRQWVSNIHVKWHFTELSVVCPEYVIFFGHLLWKHSEKITPFLK